MGSAQLKHPSRDAPILETLSPMPFYCNTLELG